MKQKFEIKTIGQLLHFLFILFAGVLLFSGCHSEKRPVSNEGLEIPNFIYFNFPEIAEVTECFPLPGAEFIVGVVNNTGMNKTDCVIFITNHTNSSVYIYPPDGGASLKTTSVSCALGSDTSIIWNWPSEDPSPLELSPYPATVGVSNYSIYPSNPATDCAVGLGFICTFYNNEMPGTGEGVSCLGTIASLPSQS